jgi:ribosome-associated protein
MIRITKTLWIGTDEIREDFIRSSGPGGQNVNKVSTAALLRFDARHSPSLPPDVRSRLERLAGGRLTGDGVVVIRAQRYRTQQRNRQDALERLVALIRAAAVKPKTRRKSQAPVKAKQERLRAKKRLGERKRLRARVSLDE